MSNGKNQSKYNLSKSFYNQGANILYIQLRYVPYRGLMANGCSVRALIARNSCGRHLLDHLAADGAGLAGSEVAVVALLQVDADLL